MPADTTQTIKRAISLLDCFTLEHPELGVREIARMVNLSSSTTGRLLASMKDLGILRQNPTSKAYSLGGKVLAWAEVYSSSLDVRNVAVSILSKLHKDTNETVSLYVLEGDQRLCVERMESDQGVRIVQRVGRRLPLYAGSAGKVFLAFLPEARRLEILNNINWEPLTEKTIIDRPTLEKELVLIRQKGYAVSMGEWILEASGVAAPIFDQKGDITAAVSLSGPSQRFNEKQISRFITEVTHVAEKISREMGYYRNPQQ